MTDKPIIFSAPMVRALLDGRKTQTRRIGKPGKGVTVADLEWDGPPGTFRTGHVTMGQIAVPYAPGDRLYVREAFAKVGDIDDDIHACPDLRVHAYYRADAVDPERQRWRSPIHMPRWASRITLTVTEVRVQRLQEISEEDAWAEGCKPGTLDDNGNPFPAEERHPKCGWVGWDNARDWYADLWENLHGPDAWDANPWVVAVSFAVERRNIDAT